MIKSILFVCTGNSCRSVMAEGLMRKWLKDHNCEAIKVTSAGIATIPGMMASANAIEVMKREYVDISSHRAQPTTTDLIKEADLILGMEPVHVQTVLGLVPDAKGKVRLLLEYAHDDEENKPVNLWVFDPIGKPKEVYEAVLITLKDAIERIGKRICV